MKKVAKKLVLNKVVTNVLQCSSSTVKGGKTIYTCRSCDDETSRYDKTCTIGTL